MFVERVRNRNSPPCILLRETYRADGKVKHRTLANLSSWPAGVVEGLRGVLKAKRGQKGEAGSVKSPENGSAFQIVRSLPHGHVAAVLTTMAKLGMARLLGSKKSPARQLCLAMIAARILSPGSKLATSRALGQETCTDTLAQECGIAEADLDENELYAAMDWLLPRQARIEKALAARHLSEGSLILYDLSSSYFEGKTCPLARRGHSRDGKKGKLQIVYGLLCNARGIPVAIEVFEGNTADPKTLGAQIEKVRQRFGIQRLVLVGDRGMITQARIDEELRPVAGLDWISALRSNQIATLARDGHIDASLFDEKNLAEIASPDFPGERLIVCRNPLLAHSRSRKREDLLQATEVELAKIATAVTRTTRPLRGADKIGLRVGRRINTYKMAKHFELTIEESTFTYTRKADAIAREAALDGLYVVRTSSQDPTLSSSDIVERYKDLSLVENAFRSIKTVDLKVRPIYHRNEDRVRCHLLLCMLAYYVEWHLRSVLAPVLFAEDDPEAARAARPDVVSPKKPSPSARAKTRTKRTPDGQPVHSFATLLKDLATITRNTIQANLPGAPEWQQDTQPNLLQSKILALIDTLPVCSQ